MGSPTPDRTLAEEELAQTIDALRLVSDQLELVLDGDDREWRDAHLLDGHDAVTRARHAVNEVRSMRAAAARHASYVPLRVVPVPDAHGGCACDDPACPERAPEDRR